jgi:nitrite reductase/ring-hydroxylating ferredoxin subunit
MSSQGLPPFPTGWFAIAFSADLTPGAVLTTRFCGHELVVFRTSAGQPAVLDAYCPHLGAHLGKGTVCDEGIRCPFHGWLWSSQGRCIEMPYGGRISPGAKTRSWPVAEQDDVILVWNGGQQPSWTMASFSDRQWTAPRRMRRTIHSHPQEILENTADLAHFRFVHGTHPMKVTARAAMDGPRFAVEIESDPDAVSEPFRLGANTLQLSGSAFCHGPGLAAATIGLPGIFSGLQRLYATPVDGAQIDLRGMVNLEIIDDNDTGEEFLGVIADSVINEWDKDIAIWESKRFLPNPLVNRAETLIPDYRKWYQQFYQPDPSPAEHQHSLIDIA